MRRALHHSGGVPFVHQIAAGVPASPGSEEPVAGIAEPGQDVALGVELAIERGAIDDDIGMSDGQATYPFGSRDKAEEANASRPGALE
jgi:hypothetical protein